MGQAMCALETREVRDPELLIQNLFVQDRFSGKILQAVEVTVNPDTVFGITSHRFEADTCDDTSLSAFTDVSMYVDWIRDVRKYWSNEAQDERALANTR